MTKLIRVRSELADKLATIARFRGTKIHEILEPCIEPMIEAEFKKLPRAMQKQVVAPKLSRSSSPSVGAA